MRVMARQSKQTNGGDGVPETVVPSIHHNSAMRSQVSLSQTQEASMPGLVSDSDFLDSDSGSDDASQLGNLTESAAEMLSRPWQVPKERNLINSTDGVEDETPEEMNLLDVWNTYANDNTSSPAKVWRDASQTNTRTERKASMTSQLEQQLEKIAREEERKTWEREQQFRAGHVYPVTWQTRVPNTNPVSPGAVPRDPGLREEKHFGNSTEPAVCRESLTLQPSGNAVSLPGLTESLTPQPTRKTMPPPATTESFRQEPARHSVPTVPIRSFAQQSPDGMNASPLDSLRSPGNIGRARQPIASPRVMKQPSPAFSQGGVFGNVNPGARINVITRNASSPRTAVKNISSPFRADVGSNVIPKQTVEALVDLKRIDRSVLSKICNTLSLDKSRVFGGKTRSLNIREGRRGPRNYQSKKKPKTGILRTTPSPTNTNSPDLAPSPLQSSCPRTPQMASSRKRPDTSLVQAQNAMTSWGDGDCGVVPWKWKPIEPMGRDPLLDFHMKDLDIHDDTDELEVINKTMNRLSTLLQAKLDAYPPEEEPETAEESVVDVMRECFGEVKNAIVDLGRLPPCTPGKHIVTQAAPCAMNVELATALMRIIDDGDDTEEDNSSVVDVGRGGNKVRDKPGRHADRLVPLDSATGIVNQRDEHISRHSVNTHGLSDASLEDLVPHGSLQRTSQRISSTSNRRPSVAASTSTSVIPTSNETLLPTGLSKMFHQADSQGFKSAEEEDAATRGSPSMHGLAESLSAHARKVSPHTHVSSHTVSIHEDVVSESSMYSLSKRDHDDAVEGRENTLSSRSSDTMDADGRRAANLPWPASTQATQPSVGRASRVFSRSMFGALPAHHGVSPLQAPSIEILSEKEIDAPALPRAQSLDFPVARMSDRPSFLSEPFDILTLRALLGKIDEDRLVAYLHARPFQGDTWVKRLMTAIEGMKSALKHAAFDLDAFDDARLLCELEYEKDRVLRGPSVPPNADVRVAVQYNAKSIVKYLIEQNANLSACDSAGKTALNIAVENGYYGMLLILHSVNAPQNYIAYQASRPAEMPACLNSVQSWDDIHDLNFALFCAALVAREDVCDYLLSLSADANAELDGDSVLYVASLNSRGHRTIELLLTRGATYPPTVGNKDARRWISRVNLSQAELGDDAERVQAFLSNEK